MRRFALGTGILALMTAGLAVFGLTGAAKAGTYEEPSFTVVDDASGYELRSYDRQIEARVTVASSYEASVRQGFRILANYIFGGNQSRSSIDMTTPVATVPSTSIDMTAPVSAMGEGQRWTVSFMMPSQWTLETLPVPNDARIELVEVAPSLRAVRTFSGRASQRRVDQELAALREAVATAGLEVVGPSAIAQFDPPWVLGPWRRNEVGLPVQTARDGS